MPSGFHMGIRSCLSTSSLPLGEDEAHGRPVPCSIRRNIPSSLWDNLVSFFHPGCPPLDKLQLFLCHSELTTTSSPLDKRLLQRSQGICTFGGRITLRNPDGMTAEAGVPSEAVVLLGSSLCPSKPGLLHPEASLVMLALSKASLSLCQAQVPVA